MTLKITAYTEEEGGIWRGIPPVETSLEDLRACWEINEAVPYQDRNGTLYYVGNPRTTFFNLQGNPISAHAIQLSNGDVWDSTLNMTRSEYEEPC